jgi:hypothetical protein
MVPKQRMIAIRSRGNENPSPENPDLSCVHCGSGVAIFPGQYRSRHFHLAEKAGNLRFAARHPARQYFGLSYPKDKPWDTTSN